MRSFFAGVLLFFSTNLLVSQDSQDNIYFPQEQLIHPDCEAVEDKNDCLRSLLQDDILEILKDDKKLYSIEKDTFNVSVSFATDKRGRLQNNFKWIFISDSVLRKSSGKILTGLLDKLPQFEVLNRKPKKYTSIHRLYYEFKIEKTGGNDINLIALLRENNKKYSGGAIEHVPVFPGCEGLSNKEARLCFNSKMMEHIRTNFRYPEEAQLKGLQGRVNIIFTIDKDGSTKDLRFRGPHKILEEEAKRIISLLPLFSPGTQNGKPVRVPFSIPITFRLQ